MSNEQTTKEYPSKIVHPLLAWLLVQSLPKGVSPDLEVEDLVGKFVNHALRVPLSKETVLEAACLLRDVALAVSEAADNQRKGQKPILQRMQ